MKASKFPTYFAYDYINEAYINFKLLLYIVRLTGIPDIKMFLPINSYNCDNYNYNYIHIISNLTKSGSNNL